MNFLVERGEKMRGIQNHVKTVTDGVIDDVYYLLSDEDAEFFGKMSPAECSKYIYDNIDIIWKYGYGYYGYRFEVRDGAKYIVHKVGCSCE